MTARKATPKAELQNDPEIEIDRTEADRLAEIDAIDELEDTVLAQLAEMTGQTAQARYNQRWASIAKTQIELGFMAMRRAADNDER